MEADARQGCAMVPCSIGRKRINTGPQEMQVFNVYFSRINSGASSAPTDEEFEDAFRDATDDAEWASFVEQRYHEIEQRELPPPVINEDVLRQLNELAERVMNAEAAVASERTELASKCNTLSQTIESLRNELNKCKTQCANLDEQHQKDEEFMKELQESLQCRQYENIQLELPQPSLSHGNSDAPTTPVAGTEQSGGDAILSMPTVSHLGIEKTESSQTPDRTSMESILQTSPVIEHKPTADNCANDESTMSHQSDETKATVKPVDSSDPILAATVSLAGANDQKAQPLGDDCGALGAEQASAVMDLQPFSLHYVPSTKSVRESSQTPDRTCIETILQTTTRADNCAKDEATMSRQSEETKATVTPVDSSDPMLAAAISLARTNDQTAQLPTEDCGALGAEQASSSVMDLQPFSLSHIPSTKSVTECLELNILGRASELIKIRRPTTPNAWEREANEESVEHNFAGILEPSKLNEQGFDITVEGLVQEEPTISRPATPNPCEREANEECVEHNFAGILEPSKLNEQGFDIPLESFELKSDDDDNASFALYEETARGGAEPLLVTITMKPRQHSTKSEANLNRPCKTSIDDDGPTSHLDQIEEEVQQQKALPLMLLGSYLVDIYKRTVLLS